MAWRRRRRCTGAVHPLVVLRANLTMQYVEGRMSLDKLERLWERGLIAHDPGSHGLWDGV